MEKRPPTVDAGDPGELKENGLGRQQSGGGPRRRFVQPQPGGLEHAPDQSRRGEPIEESRDDVAVEKQRHAVKNVDQMGPVAVQDPRDLRDFPGLHVQFRQSQVIGQDIAVGRRRQRADQSVPGRIDQNAEKNGSGQRPLGGSRNRPAGVFEPQADRRPSRRRGGKTEDQHDGLAQPAGEADRKKGGGKKSNADGKCRDMILGLSRAVQIETEPSRAQTPRHDGQHGGGGQRPQDVMDKFLGRARGERAGRTGRDDIAQYRPVSVEGEKPEDRQRDEN